jgi:SAM-dependent methyltransferase
MSSLHETLADMPNDTYFHYRDYFKDHYGATFSARDAEIQAKFLFKQLAFAIKIAELNKFKDKKILEIGSGFGTLAKLLSEAGFKNYRGIEVDKDMAEFTNRNIGNCFQNITLEEFAQNTEEKFDLIFSFEVLEHLPDPLAGIGSIKKLLNEGGVFIGTSPFPFKKNVLADRTHLFVLHPLNWQKLFLRKNFRQVQIFPMSHLPYLWRINRYLNIRIPFYLPFKYFISTALIVAHA